MIARVLIGDANAKRREDCREWVESAGYKVIEASSGAETVQQAQEKEPDVVLVAGKLAVGIFEDLTKISVDSGMAIAVVVHQDCSTESRSQILALEADSFIGEEMGIDMMLATLKASAGKKRAITKLKRAFAGVTHTVSEGEEPKPLIPLRDRCPELYQDVLRRYEEGVKLVLQSKIYKMNDDVFEPFRQIARELFVANASARDAVELHYQTLRKIAPQPEAPKAQGYLEVGRTTIIGLMGDLITCYREARLRAEEQSRSR
jgi:DNA-binding NarL/FixJ family response regulator